MDTATQNSIIVGAIVLVVLGFAAYLWLPERDTTPRLLLEQVADEPAATTTATVPTTTPKTFTNVKIALLDTEGTSAGVQRACDKVVLVDRLIAPTTGPLGGALRDLFSIDTEQVGGYYNFIARTNDTLDFDRVIITDGTAKIYLTGSLSGLAGVCDDPRAAIQIEETAMQFPTVRAVEIYLNGTRTDLTPDERGD